MLQDEYDEWWNANKERLTRTMPEITPLSLRAIFWDPWIAGRTKGYEQGEKDTRFIYDIHA